MSVLLATKRSRDSPLLVPSANLGFVGPGSPGTSALLGFAKKSSPLREKNLGFTRICFKSRKKSVESQRPLRKAFKQKHLTEAKPQVGLASGGFQVAGGPVVKRLPKKHLFDLLSQVQRYKEDFKVSLCKACFDIKNTMPETNRTFLIKHQGKAAAFKTSALEKPIKWLAIQNSTLKCGNKVTTFSQKFP